MTNATRQLFLNFRGLMWPTRRHRTLDELAKRFACTTGNRRLPEPPATGKTLEEYESHVFIVLKTLMQAGKNPKFDDLDVFLGPELPDYRMTCRRVARY